MSVININRVTFHIKGMQKSKERDSLAGEPNYVEASLKYDSRNGIGYYRDILPINKWMLGDVEMVSVPLGIAVPTPRLKESLVACARQSKKREQEAADLFNSNVVSAITHRLGYEIEIED